MPHLNKQEEKIQKQMEKQFSDDTNREWRERFDKKFGTFTVGAGKGGTIATEYTLKSFIQEELTREREEYSQEILKIRNMLIRVILKINSLPPVIKYLESLIPEKIEKDSLEI